MRKDLYYCFIYYIKAFDRDRHEEIIILDSLNKGGKDLSCEKCILGTNSSNTK